MRIRLEMLEELVGGGDDVLYFRARAGFQYGQRVDENCLIGDQFRCLLELGKGGPGRDALPQDDLGIQLRRGRQLW